VSTTNTPSSQDRYAVEIPKGTAEEVTEHLGGLVPDTPILEKDNLALKVDKIFNQSALSPDRSRTVTQFRNLFQPSDKPAELADIVIDGLGEILSDIRPPREPRSRKRSDFRHDVFIIRPYDWIFRVYNLALPHARPETLVRFVKDSLQPCLGNHVAIEYEASLKDALRNTKRRLKKIDPPSVLLLKNIDL
jgi:hypothetical protein